MGDRARSDTLRATHELLARVLGVRRESVTVAVASLRGRGLVEYNRSHMEIVDRPGLTATSCSCYETDRKIYRDMLG
jgi:hypothetical protein